MNLLEGCLDLVLHLLDRQVIAEDGALACKVDDVELTEDPDGTLVVTGLLAGPAALVPRLGRKSGRGLQQKWAEMVVERADGNVPYRIDLELVDRVDSAVHLKVSRDEVLVRQDSEPVEHGVRSRRLNDLLHSSVRSSSDLDRDLGRVTDVRAEPHEGRLTVDQLIIGRDRPGGLLGYDRKQQGPALLRMIVRALHRGTGIVGVSQVDSIAWDDHIVHVEGEPAPVTSALAASQGNRES